MHQVEVRRKGIASDDSENKGTTILDTICAPQNIRFSQDIHLLNEVRENLEKMIDGLCEDNGYYRPRIYRENARRRIWRFWESYGVMNGVGEVATFNFMEKYNGKL